MSNAKIALQPTISVAHSNSAAVDLDRVDAIFNRITADTTQVFNMLKKGMIEEASLKTVEENIARDYIMQTFEEVRLEAYDDAVRSARHFATMCGQASEHLTASHQKNLAKCVAELFEQFASRLDSHQMTLATAGPTGPDKSAERRGGDVRPLLATQI